MEAEAAPEDRLALHIDVYITRRGPWNPEYGELARPPGWDELSPGDAFLTAQTKKQGAYWLLWEPSNRNHRYRRSLGLWAPSEAIERAKALAAQTQERRALARVRGAAQRERAEGR